MSAEPVYLDFSDTWEARSYLDLNASNPTKGIFVVRNRLDNIRHAEVEPAYDLVHAINGFLEKCVELSPPNMRIKMYVDMESQVSLSGLITPRLAALQDKWALKGHVFCLTNLTKGTMEGLKLYPDGQKLHLTSDSPEQAIKLTTERA